MPRTKKPARNSRKEKSSEDDGVLKKLDKLANELKKKVDIRRQTEIKNLEIAFKILLDSISPSHLQMTVAQLKSELYLKEVPNIRVTGESIKSHDDGYLTENSTQGSGERSGVRKHMGIPVATHRPNTTVRRSRSADASCRKPSAALSTASKPSQRRRSRSVYRTPAYNKNVGVNYPPITPKVTPQTPLTVFRQPRLGEMMLSMSGSPLMAPACSAMNPDAMANCNIRLHDGTMLSLQPKELRQSQAYIPFSLMDENVLNQLKTLQNNLGKVVKLGEKAMK
ncbi:hypothetical protein K1T71_012833 [Dendrolimus kikuchii]|uniref:Uncharacterized protein n=1 Tax=Dendrolimus kikuchii TaxID=765133 RepID=A0ACC1CIC2_9NEOP|nr:hypothetical protein K1T71_012833 [Dendrolimus kikuchii]